MKGIKGKKLNSYRKRKYMLIGAFAALLLFSSGLGVFSDMIVSKKLVNNGTQQEVKRTLPKVSSLSTYWDKLKTADLVNGKTSLKSFVNQNGAIFQNLVASKKYSATAALNQLVSTPKQIEINSNQQTAQKIKETYKEQVRKDAEAFYNFLAEPIRNADEFISKVNLLKQSYPEFYNNFVRARGQNYGVWVRKNYKSPKSLFDAIPNVGENDERYVDQLYLKNNYKDLIVSTSEAAYANTLKNMFLVSSAQQLGSLVKTTSPVDGGEDSYYSESIKDNRSYINAKYLTSLFLYGNRKDHIKQFAKSLFDAGLKQNAKHNDHKRHYHEMLSCVWTIVCVVPAAMATPSSHPIQWGPRTDGEWIATSKYNLDSIIKYGAYPTLAEKNESGAEKVEDRVVLLPNVDNSRNQNLLHKEKINNWADELEKQAHNGATDSWSWTDAKTWEQTRIILDRVSRTQKRRNGLSQAEGDLEYLSNVYFEKISKEWKEEIDKIKAGNNKIYFNNIFSTGKNSTIDLMRNEFRESLFNPAMKEYWLDLTQQLNNEILKFGSYYDRVNRDGTNTIRLKYTNYKQPWGFLTKDWRSFGGNNDRTTELKDLDKYIDTLFENVKHILSEKNKKAIFKRHIDEIWNKNKEAYESKIKEKLNKGKRDADVEFAKFLPIIREYLKTAYNDENFIIANPVKDQLNQQSIPAQVGGKVTNFSIIPSGNMAISPDGFDKRAQDILDTYLTKNVVLSKLLEKKSGIGELLSKKSVLVQREYINSLFATLRKELISYLEPIFNRFATQNHQLWNEYLEALRGASNKEFSPAEVELYGQTVLAKKSILHSNILDMNVKSVKLAKGFLLDVLEINKFNDESGKYKTLFETIDDSKEFGEYILGVSSSLLD